MTEETKIAIDLPLNWNDSFVVLKAGQQFFATIYTGTDLAYAKCMVDGFHIMMLEETLLPFPGTEFCVKILKVDVESAYDKLDKEVVIRIKGEIV